MVPQSPKERLEGNRLTAAELSDEVGVRLLRTTEMGL